MVNVVDGGVFEYAAFVSYRHAPLDKTWAKWLVDQLETYELPKHLQQRGFPRKIGKIYRDEDEAHAGARLGDHIADALRKSRAMIVVCTSNTQGSPWIERELAYFRDLGRGEQVFCLLVEGEPAASFPESLYEVSDGGSFMGGAHSSQAIAADVREAHGAGGKQRIQDAKLRLIAGIIGCGFDELKQRDRERHKQRQKRLGLIASLAAFAMLSTSVWYWDQNRIKTNYFAHATTYWGEPVGVGAIDESEFRNREMAFLVRTQGGRTVSIERRGYSRALAFSLELLGSEAVNRWDVRYESDGDVERILAYDRYGELYQVQDFEVSQHDRTAFIDFRSPEGAIQFTSDVDLLGTSSENPDNRTEITRHFLRFGENGLVSVRMFRNQSRLPKRDQSGYFGHSFEYDDLGLETLRTALDLDEQPVRVDDVPNVTRTLRSDEGLIESRQSLLAAGILASNRRGYAEARYEYDDLDNVSAFSFWAADGQPANHRDGYHLGRIDRDERGNPIEYEYFDQRMQTASMRGEHHRWEGRYDEAGNVTWSRFHVLDDAPYPDRRGFAVYRARYDESGRRVEARYFDENDRPVLGYSGAHIIRHSYDDDGNLTETQYFDVDGRLRQPGTGGFEHAIIRIGYNTAGQRISEHYFDDQTEATRGPYGIHQWVGAWDPVRGFLIETRFFDESGDPALNTFGYHMWRAEYDDRGYRIAQSYFGLDGNPTLREDGYHRTVNEYDRFGQRIETRNFGINREPVLRFGSHFIWRAEYDERGNRISETVFNIEGQPVNHANGGYHRLEMEYNALGVEISRRAFDARGREIDGW